MPAGVLGQGSACPMEWGGGTQEPLLGPVGHLWGALAPYTGTAGEEPLDKQELSHLGRKTAHEMNQTRPVFPGIFQF